MSDRSSGLVGAGVLAFSDELVYSIILDKMVVVIGPGSATRVCDAG